MPKLPLVTAERVISVRKKIGFEVMRQRESHVRLKHKDGRVVTVPVKILGKDYYRKSYEILS